MKKLKNWLLYPYRKLWAFSDWLVYDFLKLGNAKTEMPSTVEELPSTVEEFNNLFRGNLHGTWDTAADSHGGTVCMTDIYVAFKQGGQGCYQFGLLERGEFLWRQFADFQIEVKKGSAGDWAKIDYEFSKVLGHVLLILWPHKGTPEWASNMTLEDLPLSCL